MGYLKISISWDAPVNPVLGYKLWKSSDGGITYRLYQTLSGAVVEYVDYDVDLGQSYFYKLSAFNSYGNGPLTSALSGIVSTVPSQVTDLAGEWQGDVPGEPLNLTASGDVVGGAIVLSWEEPERDGGRSIIAYNVYRNDVFLASVPPIEFTYTDAGHNVDDEFTYYVTDINAIGEGAPSDLVTGIVETPSFTEIYLDEFTNPDIPSFTTEFRDFYTAGAPTAPELASCAVFGDHIRLQWVAPGGGDPPVNYEIWRGVSSGGEVLVDTIAGNITLYEDHVVVPATYYYKLKASNTGGTSDFSNELFTAFP